MEDIYATESNSEDEANKQDLNNFTYKLIVLKQEILDIFYTVNAIRKIRYVKLFIV